MSKKGIPNPKKAYIEINKPIWIVQTEEGKIIDRYRNKNLAEKFKKHYEKEYFTNVEIVRDNSYRKKLKESLKKK